jgi:hypothetical protein
MQLSFGPVTIHFGSNGKYVKREDCHEAHDKLDKSLDTRFESLRIHLDTRINDLVNATNNYIDLLKK